MVNCINWNNLSSKGPHWELQYDLDSSDMQGCKIYICNDLISQVKIFVQCQIKGNWFKVIIIWLGHELFCALWDFLKKHFDFHILEGKKNPKQTKNRITLLA